MNNLKKTLALLLAVVMVVGMFPMNVFAEDEPILKIRQNGAEVSSVEFPSNKLAHLTVSSNEGIAEYQWQILIPNTDQWVDIFGENSDSLKVSYAMIRNMQNASGNASVRCVAIANGEEVASKAITLSVGEAEHPEMAIPEHVPVAAPVNQADLDAESAMENAIAKQDAADAAYDAAEAAKKAAKEAATKAAEAETAAAAAEEAALSAETVAAEKKAAYEELLPTDAEAETEVSSEELATAEEEWKVATAAAEEARAAANEAAAVSAAAAEAKTAADAAASESWAKYEAAQAEADTAAEVAMSYGGGMATYGARMAVPATYTVTINYVFEDGTAAAESWHGEFNGGTTYQLNVKSPEVQGYVYDIANITRDFTFSGATEKNTVLTVTYTPTNVTYTVEHYLQNVNDDGYTKATDFSMTCQALTGAPVGSSYKGTAYVTERTGFKVLDFDTTLQVAADGSTVVKIYYDRLYYLMSFELGEEGYGVQPIYARYGTQIPQNLTPIRSGYSFTGWTPTVPATMPAKNQTHTAGWQAGKNVNVNLVFWYENANDANYTCVGSATSTAAYSAGATVTPSQFKDVAFTGRDKNHFVFNNAKNSAVNLNADGTTIVNIYFTRKTYKMIFFNCRQDGHVSDEYSCYPATRAEALNYVEGLSDREDTELNPSGSWIWGISIYTRKWQQNVRPDWENGIANRANTRRWRPYEVYGAAGQLIYDGDMNVSTMNVMPDADIVFRFLSTGTVECTMNYWITPVRGESTAGKTTETVDGVTYVLRNKVVTMMGGITEYEEYVDIEGFTKVYTWSQLASKGYITNGDDLATAHFFYKRNGYNLTYISNGVTVKTAKIDFDALLKSASNYNAVPLYPSNYEPGAYEFKGWYVTENCAAGTEVNWNTAKMPVGGTSVYAKWEPVSHTVKTSGEGITAQSFTVQHGKKVSNAPEDPTKEGYEFISWFYMENGKEIPFTFDMPIVKDLTIYPKWKQAAIVKGTLYFKLKDTDTAVADPQVIESLIGETKTYSAKTVDELYDDYKVGYFPETVSTNIAFGEDESKNIYTFEYVWKESVPYTVKYLEAGTNKVLAEAKETTTQYASVVENFKPVAGYLPDLYKKQLLLSANGTNELIFWYTADDERAPILRGHYLQNIEDDNYITYQETWDGYGIIGETYTEAPLTKFEGTDINGFTLNVAKSTQSGTLTAEGLELKLYYDRNLYPYEFRFVDQDGKTIHDPITGTAKFESIVEQDALVIPGYILRELTPSQEKQNIEIQIEDGTTAVKNVKTLIYDAAYTSLKINKTVSGGVEPDQTFVFHVEGTPDRVGEARIDMYVTIDADGGSTTLNQLPVGTYKVTELVDWSWRYEIDGGSSVQNNIKLINPAVTEEVSFTNKRTMNKWLSCEAYADNIFGAYVERN